MSIAVDFDGTLATYDKWRGMNYTGEPIEPMVRRVKQWLSRGKKVVIFTTRARSSVGVKAIEEWLEKNGLPKLRITNIKEHTMEEFWDDKAVKVEPNTGIVNESEYLINYVKTKIEKYKL